MKVSEAGQLLGTAVPANTGGTWADFGAGEGTFTLALARLLGFGILGFLVIYALISLLT